MLDGNSYLVQRYNSTSTATRKYNGSELYLLPPSLFPHEPVDTMDQRYLNSSSAPVVFSLEKALHIDMYNEKHYSINLKHTTSPSFDIPSCRVDESALNEHHATVSIPSAASLFEELYTSLPAIESIPCASLNDLPDVTVFSNKLFFIQFTPDGTMRRRWYLIQVDIEFTLEINLTFASNNLYWRVFLARNPDNH